jgi:hypothetical protein
VGNPRNLCNERRWCLDNDPCDPARMARLGRRASRDPLSSTSAFYSSMIAPGQTQLMRNHSARFQVLPSA